MKLILERQIQLAFIIALLLLLLLGFFAYRSANSMNEALVWEKHTQETLLQLNDTLNLITDAETGGRGFVITGNESYLEPFNNANGQINQNLSILHGLIADNPKQLAEISTLENLITEKLNFMNAITEIRRNQGLEAASERIKTNVGKKLMDEIRLSIGKMKDEEQRVLKMREADLDKNISNTLFILSFGMIAGIVSLGLANFAVYRSVGQRRIADEEIRVANQGLEKRVEERTRELSQKNEALKVEIKQRENAELRRRSALEAGNLGTWTLDPKNNKAEIDARSLTLFGLGSEDFDGSHEKVFSRVYEEDYPQVEELFQKSLAERANFNAKFRVKMPDGSIRWNHCIGQPQLDENGEIIHIVGHCNDITENKEYEAVLLEKGHFNRAIIDSLSAHIAVLDKAGNIVAVNEAWENFAQANSVGEQIASTEVGQNYLYVCEKSDVFDKDTKHITENLWAVLRGEKNNFAFEYPWHSPHEERWFLLQVSAMRGTDGGAVISHIDISARKKAEQALRENKEQLDFILDAAQIGIWRLNIKNNTAVRSLLHDRIFGYDELLPEWTYEIFLNHVLPEDREEVDKKFQEAVKNGTEWNFETRIRRTDGEVHWIWAHGQGQGNGDNMSQMVGTITDITERKKAEQELKNSEQFNRSIFENSPDCVKILNLDGTIHSINTNGLCIMEIDEISPFIGKQWIDFWEGDENELAYQAVQSASKGKPAKFEGFRKTAKGTLRYWDVAVAPVFDAEGKPIRLVSTSRDITERREAEHEREDFLKREQAARKDAEIANRLRDEFLATVSHELRAPLNSILGWGRILQKGNLDEQTTEKAIGTIVRNADSQNRLIEDLLDVSRIISGKLRLEVITIKPINLVESALETVRPAAEAKGITLEIKDDADISHISGDPNRLQQVIWNLLSNAIKFTPNDGKVTLEIERDNDFVELRVKDTGVGIKKEFLPHVFERFRQADASSIRQFGGLGLGLAIVRHITEMHGGTVEVFSEGEGKGATFTVRLPLITSPIVESEAETAMKLLAKNDIPKIDLDGLLILVVDDEEDTRQLLVQALTFHGATVISANSVKNALAQVMAKSPDVLVSDIGMPGEDGYSLIRQIRALPDKQQRDMPAIALTAFTRAHDRVRALATGFQNHVSKPVEPDELATVIASLTGRLHINDAE